MWAYNWKNQEHKCLHGVFTSFLAHYRDTTHSANSTQLELQPLYAALPVLLTHRYHLLYHENLASVTTAVFVWFHTMCNIQSFIHSAISLNHYGLKTHSMLKIFNVSSFLWDELSKAERRNSAAQLVNFVCRLYLMSYCPFQTISALSPRNIATEKVAWGVTLVTRVQWMKHRPAFYWFILCCFHKTFCHYGYRVFSEWMIGK